MTLDHKNPVLRVVPGPGDINANGHIFAPAVAPCTITNVDFTLAAKARVPTEARTTKPTSSANSRSACRVFANRIMLCRALIGLFTALYRATIPIAINSYN
jgi:hypothetical protein